VTARVTHAGSNAARYVWPVGLIDVDLDALEPIELRTSWGQPCGTAWLIAWRGGVPVDVVEVHSATGMLGPDEIRALCTSRDDAPTRVSGAEFTESDVTVVICTRDNPDALGRVLESLTAMPAPPATVLVADNLSTGTLVREVAQGFADRLPIEYQRVGPAGLANARNAALAHVRTGLVAWIDDDEQVAPTWLGQVVAAFVHVAGAAAVSGVVLPAEFRTEAQYLFELYGGHVKGRGFTPATFNQRTMAQSPLYPLPPFGVGANMAFRTAVLRELGGFDPALGAGTPTRGGEDTEVFSKLLLAGHTAVYWPWAATKHVHRATFDELVDQLTGYARGLTAYYTAMALANPRNLLAMARLAPAALREVRSGRSPDNHAIPAWLGARKRAAMLSGPGLYLRIRVRNTWRRAP